MSKKLPIKATKQKPKFRLVMFYPRAHQPEFRTEQEARDYVKARALTRSTICYTEVWRMESDDDGEHVTTFDYGCKEPEELVRK